MQNLLVLGNQLTLYVGPLPAIGQHRHSAGALCVGLHAPIRARGVVGTPWQDYDKLFVPANVEHALSFGGQPVAVLFFEEQSRIYRQLLVHYRIPDACLSNPLEIAHDWVEEMEELTAENPRQGEELLEKIMSRLLPNGTESVEIDARVRKTLALMQAEPHRNFTAQELAVQVCLSPSRLSAIFMQDMGLPLRRYRVWLRLRSIVGYINHGMSLTEAAHMAGFSDSAHFSNSCRKLLGIKPTDVLAMDGSLRIMLSAHL